MINKVILIGNLGRDPEIRTTTGGSSVGRLSVATTERVKDKSGEWTDHTEWHRVVVFGKTAENCGRFLSKGRTIYVEGRLRTEKWKDKDGQDRYTTEVIAGNVRFIGGGGNGESTKSGGGHKPSGGRQDSDSGSGWEDIPF